MKRKINQQGFAHLVGVVVVLLIAAIMFIGYRVWASNVKEDVKTSSTSTVAETKEPEWTEKGLVIPGTYADADIVKVSDTQWRLYYSIQPEVSGNNLEVYSSTSTDGKTWTQKTSTRKPMATFPDVLNTFRETNPSSGILKLIVVDGLNGFG